MHKYPLLLKPAIKDYIWGGRRLIDEYGFETNGEIAAEAWMLSCHKDGTNTVLNGFYAGKTLDCVLAEWGFTERFPILIKLIDAKQKLSVQVHPDDDYALENEGELGKTEMWYVVDCEPGAKLAYGFNENISADEFEKRIKDNTLDDVINYVPVKKGDVFFISAGTLHAIGEGILIAEVQQNSNTTYRVSDYGRLGADGKPRELHVEKALDVTICETPKMPYGNVGEIIVNGDNTVRELASCDKFSAKLLNINSKYELSSADDFVSLIVLDGELAVKWDNDSFNAKKGDSIFVPNGVAVLLEGKAQLLVSK